MSTGGEEDPIVELVTFSSKKGCYAYIPIPPSTMGRHRAELWDVENWSHQVQCRTVSRGDELIVRMFDHETGELFAECPLPPDGSPLTTAVEPVVDSSRYFVLRLEDPVSKNHAFIGMGFRERGEASDFCAALDEYRQYLRRKREAEEFKFSYEQQQQMRSADAEDGTCGEGTSVSPAATADPSGARSNYKLTDKIHININGIKPASGDKGGIILSSSSLSEGCTVVKVVDGSLKLSPPPPAAAVAVGVTAVPIASGASPSIARLSASVLPLPGEEGADEDDGWGGFVG